MTTLTTPGTPGFLRPAHASRRGLRETAARFDLIQLGIADDVPLRGATLSTNDLREGDLFVALGGQRQHGAEFAGLAARRGAAAVLTDSAGATLAVESGLPTLVTPDPRAMLGELSAWIYGTDSATPQLFGVTGTNGKTSTTHLIEAILRQLGTRTGLSSTAERHVGDVSTISGLTTPEATELHALLARMREEQVDAVALEVSAQALTRQRVDGVRFDVAGFTNLSHDHLDDYGDMRTYLEAKAALFHPTRARKAVISLDSPSGAELAELASVPFTTVTSRPDVDADWRVEVTSQQPDGVAFTVTSPDGEHLSSRVPVIGRHMAANAGLAIGMLVAGGHSFEHIARAIASGIQVSIPGRTERVSGDRGPAVFVDFGHSADAFAHTLEAVRQVTEGRVIMVFGADGDRDATKRPAMAEAAVRGSDILIVTDHHPRFEDPDSIRATLVAAARQTDPDHPVTDVADPKRAIRVAVGLAREGDSILWAGPGHQNYRDIRGERVPYSARSEARMALAEVGW